MLEGYNDKQNKDHTPMEPLFYKFIYNGKYEPICFDSG